MSQELLQYCQSFKLTLADVHKMNEEQFEGFKHIFKKFEGDVILREINENIELFGLNREVIDLVSDSLLQVYARKNTASSGLNQQKADVCSAKIKLTTVPEGIFEEDVYEFVEHPATDEQEARTEQVLAQPKNTNVQMLLRLRIPKKTVEVPDGDSITHEPSKSADSAPVKEKLSAASAQKESARKESSRKDHDADSAADTQKMKQVEVECEQEDRVLAVATRLESLPFGIQVIHQAASRWHRKEIGQVAKKVVGDSGEGSVDLEASLRRAEDLSDAVEQAYIEKHCGRDKLPVYDHDLHTLDE